MKGAQFAWSASDTDRPEASKPFVVLVSQAAEKVFYFAIPSDARNLSSI